MLTVAVLGAVAGIAVHWVARDSAVVRPETDFIGVMGEKYSMTSLRGKVVLVNFWATSCTVCVEEMPEIIRTYEKFQHRPFDTVAVAMSYDPPNRVAAFAQNNKLPFRVALDIFGKAAAAFKGIRGTPTTFLVGKDGQVVRKFEGAPDFGQLEMLIEKELAKG
ncbi:MAG: TlpA family protein disulfide reductase [Burkholderiales bacterium]